MLERDLLIEAGPNHLFLQIRGVAGATFDLDSVLTVLPTLVAGASERSILNHTEGQIGSIGADTIRRIIILDNETGNIKSRGCIEKNSQITKNPSI